MEKKNNKVFAVLRHIPSVAFVVLAVIISRKSTAGVVLAALAAIASSPFLYDFLKKTKVKKLKLKTVLAVGVLAVALAILLPIELKASKKIEEEPKQPETMDTKTALSYTTDGMMIYFADVWQADATFVCCDGHLMIIDCGDEEGSGETTRKSIAAFGNEPEVLVVTHMDEDHCGAADYYVQWQRPKTVYWPEQMKDTKSCKDAQTAAIKVLANVVHPHPGDTFMLGSAKVTVLAPKNKEYEDINNSSIALLIEYKDEKYLFTGDAEELAEQEILEYCDASGTDISGITIYKVGHHGSSSSTTQALLDRISPKSAVISCGLGNDFGHPTEKTLDKLQKAGCDIYRTDRQGDIRYYYNGTDRRWNVEPCTDMTPGVYNPDADAA